jgi:hypothetical protein
MTASVIFAICALGILGGAYELYRALRVAVLARNRERQR